MSSNASSATTTLNQIRSNQMNSKRKNLILLKQLQVIHDENKAYDDEILKLQERKKQNSLRIDSILSELGKEIDSGAQFRNSASISSVYQTADVGDIESNFLDRDNNNANAISGQRKEIQEKKEGEQEEGPHVTDVVSLLWDKVTTEIYS